MSKNSKDQGFQAFRILQIAFVIAPVVAGFDKFFNILTDWSNYIAPFFQGIMNGNDQGFMMAVGVIEIIAGIGVLLKPKIFAYIISIWLFCIIINLLMTGQYFDIALRDTGLLLSSLALGKLSQKYSKK
jgi:uncharacterized membrane protein YphA (DoxX/SURF4 family)